MAHCYWYLYIYERYTNENTYNWVSSHVVPYFLFIFAHSSQQCDWLYVKDTGMNLNILSSVLSSVCTMYILCGLWKNAIILTVNGLHHPLVAPVSFSTFHIDHECVFSLFFAFFLLFTLWLCYHFPLQVFFIQC